MEITMGETEIQQAVSIYVANRTGMSVKYQNITFTTTDYDGEGEICAVVPFEAILAK